MENEIEETSTSEMIKEYAGLFWHWAWLLVLFTVLAGGVAYEISRNGTKIYQASTLVMISGAPGTQSDSYSALYLSQQLAQTYAQVMTTRPIYEAVAERLGLESFPASVQVQPVTNTQLLQITVQDTDPDRAALIANTLVAVFADQLQAEQASRYLASKQNLEAQLTNLDQQIEKASAELAAIGEDTINQAQRIQQETTLAQYRQSYAYLLQSYEQIRLAEAQSMSNISQKETAIPQRSPIQPQPLRSTMLAAVVGFMIAAGIVYLNEFLNDTIRNPDEITRKWGIPILGVIATFKSNGDGLITVREPRSPVSEAFRSLRTNLQFASVDSPIHTLLVTSPSPEDGKSTISSNLASVLAQSGQKVVIMDADLRRPKIHKYFKVPNRFGLTDLFIRSQNNLDGALQSTDNPNLQVITSGSLPPNPSELLNSMKMIDLFQQLSNSHDIIIVDSPPVLVVTDATVLAPRVDGVLLVVKPNVTKRAAIKLSVEQIRRVGANVLGVVLNEVSSKGSRYTYYNGYYYYQYNQKYSYYSRDTEPAARKQKKSKRGETK